MRIEWADFSGLLHAGKPRRVTAVVVDEYSWASAGRSEMFDPKAMVGHKIYLALEGGFDADVCESNSTAECALHREAWFLSKMLGVPAMIDVGDDDLVPMPEPPEVNDD